MNLHKEFVEEFKNDKNKFYKIYNSLYSPLKYFIFSYVKDEDSTSDILSETFYKIYIKSNRKPVNFSVDLIFFQKNIHSLSNRTYVSLEIDIYITLTA